MAKGYVGSNTYRGFLGNVKMKKGYLGATKVYSAGEIITYVIDTGNTKQEEIDEGASVLSPRTFTPSKTGWTFVGWRSDKTADSSVLTNKTMGDSPITLYAVFRQTVTISYSGNGNTGGSTASQTGYRYYNNGNVTNPSITLHSNSFTKTGYSFKNWKNGSTLYVPNQTITVSADLTMIAQWVGNPFTVKPRNIDWTCITLVPYDNPDYGIDNEYKYDDYIYFSQPTVWDSDWGHQPLKQLYYDSGGKKVALHYISEEIQTKDCEFVDVTFRECYMNHGNASSGSRVKINGITQESGDGDDGVDAAPETHTWNVSGLSSITIETWTTYMHDYNNGSWWIGDIYFHN